MSPSDNIVSGMYSETTANWTKGVNTLKNAWNLPPNQFKWGLNVNIRGGIAQTRPGNTMRLSLPPGNLQGCIFFAANKPFQESDVINKDTKTTVTSNYIYQPNGQRFEGLELPYIVFAVDGYIYYAPFPLTQPKNWEDFRLKNIKLDKDVDTLYFTICNKTSSTDYSDIYNITPSYNILIIHDGVTTTGYWDGSNNTGNINNDIPIGSISSFSGNRLWIASGNVLLASDLGDPLSWVERQSGVGRGDLYFDQKITALTDYIGINNTTSLMVFTSRSTYLLQSGILDRRQWLSTLNFQTILYYDIGCIAKKSIAYLGGILWWYTSHGLVSSDIAATNRLSSQVLYRDDELNRITQSLNSDLSGVCSIAYEDYLLISVPYYEALNSTTMVLDYSPANETQNSFNSAWAGVWSGTRPVNWTTGYIQNNKRLFHCSVDYVSTNDNSYNSLWESFTSNRQDQYLYLNKDGSTQLIDQRIYCQFETALIGEGMNLKTIEYAILELQQILGEVDLQASYRGSKGNYINFLTKKILALSEDYQYQSDTFNEVKQQLGMLFSQYRRVYTKQIQKTNVSTTPETRNSNYIDKAFSILLEWCGQMGVEAIQIYSSPWTDVSFGLIENNETTFAAIGENGAIGNIDLPQYFTTKELTNNINNNEVFTSLQTGSVTNNCSTDTGNNVTVTTSAYYKSIVSQKDADQQAQLLANNIANLESNNFRKKNPCI